MARVFPNSRNTPKRVKPNEQNIVWQNLYNRINKFGDKLKELKFKLKRRYDEFIKYVDYVHQKVMDLKEVEGKKKDTVDENSISLK